MEEEDDESTSDFEDMEGIEGGFGGGDPEEGDEEEEEEDLDVQFDPLYFSMMPDCADVKTLLAYEKRAMALINKAPSCIRNGSDFRVSLITEFVSMVEHFWKEEELISYAQKQTNLWPYVTKAVGILQGSGRLNNYNLLDNTIIPPEIFKEYESAITTLLGGIEKPQLQTWESDQDLVNYENMRIQLLIERAEIYHKYNKSRPGFQHEYGQLLPVQISFDMIEYLMCAMGVLDYDFEKNLKENTVFFPEVAELTPDGRRLMENVFVMDPSFRREFLILVKNLRNEAGYDTTPEEEFTIIALFDEMNSIFNMDFENLIMDEAEMYNRLDEIARVRHINQDRFRQLADEAGQARRIFMEMVDNDHHHL
uniref:Uncharacterized protein n=1 Tax=Caenorhabditis japonica TaxID=281687 RepID=A0A8R1HWV0_CAEJA